MKDFRKFKTSNEDINKLQDNLVAYFTNFNGTKIIDGLLLENITLKNGETLVSHKLDRQIVGYIVISKDKNVNIWDSTKNNKTITLLADGDCKVNLWVF